MRVNRSAPVSAERIADHLEEALASEMFDPQEIKALAPKPDIPILPVINSSDISVKTWQPGREYEWQGKVTGLPAEQHVFVESTDGTTLVTVCISIDLAGPAAHCADEALLRDALEEKADQLLNSITGDLTP